MNDLSKAQLVELRILLLEASDVLIASTRAVLEWSEGRKSLSPGEYKEWEKRNELLHLDCENAGARVAEIRGEMCHLLEVLSAEAVSIKPSDDSEGS